MGENLAEREAKAKLEIEELLNWSVAEAHESRRRNYRFGHQSRSVCLHS